MTETPILDSAAYAHGFVTGRFNSLLPLVGQVKHLSNESKNAANVMSLSDFRSSGLRIPSDSTLFDEILRYVESANPDEDHFIVVSDFSGDEVPDEIFEDIDIHFFSVNQGTGLTTENLEELETLI